MCGGKVAKIKQRYSTGIDSYRFVIPKSVALGFLKKLELYTKLRATTRNKQVQQFCKDKFKSLKSEHAKYPFKVRYINLKRGVKSLSNTILFLENSKELHDIARKNKKKLDYYVMIIFAGLHQPSKDIESNVFKTLAQFVRRFKTYSFDLAYDFDSERNIDYTLKEWLGSNTKQWSGGQIISVGKSLYANRIVDSKRYYNLSRILFYDKFYKQKHYHKEKIPQKYEHWKRLELTFNLKAKFLEQVENESINEALDVLNDMARSIGAVGLMGADMEILSLQLQLLKDLRRNIRFRAWIREAG